MAAIESRPAAVAILDVGAGDEVVPGAGVVAASVDGGAALRTTLGINLGTALGTGLDSAFANDLDTDLDTALDTLFIVNVEQNYCASSLISP